MQRPTRSSSQTLTSKTCGVGGQVKLWGIIEEGSATPEGSQSEAIWAEVGLGSSGEATSPFPPARGYGEHCKLTK